MNTTSGLTEVNAIQPDGGTRVTTACGMQHVVLEPAVDLYLWYSNLQAFRLEFPTVQSGGFTIRVWFHGTLNLFEQDVGVYASSGANWVTALVGADPSVNRQRGMLLTFTDGDSLSATSASTVPATFSGGSGSVSLKYESATGTYTATAFNGSLANAGSVSIMRPVPIMGIEQTVGLFVSSSSANVAQQPPPGNDVWLERFEVCVAP